ncbi:putative sterol 24-C-methyltransferase [Amylocarpus encephaloides]|uniref:Sterol 24-C-methyltransferase n=1 Tax=Amylocarpus encephaloides TaxID=45428 RepID=A0A9P7Y7J4_9HELO|nr:putative sterol 24-C-methyltransferase [Amylocarpus encephaloides]
MSPENTGVEYRKFWKREDVENKNKEELEKRKESGPDIGNAYYDMATYNYENGWGRKFHFCRLQPGECLEAGLARHEYFLALNLKLEPGMKVLDIGCGIGGPAREISAFAGVHVTGITINKVHINRAKVLTAESTLGDEHVKFQEADFCNIPHPDDYFDAVYAIESTVYAPHLQDVFKEVLRILKPGGLFGTYEFLMTPHYDPTNARHNDIKIRIERGTGCHIITTEKDVKGALSDVGLELVRAQDMGIVTREDSVPWWEPIDGNLTPFWAWQDLVKVFCLKKWVFNIAYLVILLGSLVGLVAGERIIAMEEVSMGVFGMRDGGKLEIFSPMFFFVARKPTKLSQKE